jgi:hypothetical protein
VRRSTEVEITALEQAYREKSREFDRTAQTLKAEQFRQRMHYLALLCPLTLVCVLGYTAVVRLWTAQPEFTRWAGIVIILAASAAAVNMLVNDRNKVVDLTSELHQALLEKQTAAAALPLYSETALRFYRESTLELMESYRKRASTNRRVNNGLQVLVIAGSIIASTLVALDDRISPLNLAATILTAAVGVAAGLSGYFKFRERGFNLQTATDELEKHYIAVQFHLDEYETVDSSLAPDEAEKERLRRFARFVERIKEEQRKREIQLEHRGSSFSRGSQTGAVTVVRSTSAYTSWPGRETQSQSGNGQR